jgi:hypothetical protein
MRKRSHRSYAPFAVVLGGVSLAGAPARGDGPCRVDRDCPGEEVCNAGVCSPPAAAPAPATTPPAPGTAPTGTTPSAPNASTGPAAGATQIGGQCYSNPDCAPGLACKAFTCQKAELEARDRVMLGLMYQYGIGIAGTSGNGNTTGSANTGDTGGAHLVGFTLDAGSTVDEARKITAAYHLKVGFQTVSSPSISGGHIAPLNFALGYKVLDGNIRLELGVIVNATSIDLGAGTWSTTIPGSPPNSQFTMFLQSGAALRAIVGFGSFFAAISPIGFEARWLTFHTFDKYIDYKGSPNSEGQTESGPGINWPVGLTVGVQFEKQKD